MNIALLRDGFRVKHTQYLVSIARPITQAIHFAFMLRLPDGPLAFSRGLLSSTLSFQRLSFLACQIMTDLESMSKNGSQHAALNLVKQLGMGTVSSFR